MDEDRLSGRIKVATKSTSDLVNSLGSIKNIIHTLVLVGGGVCIGLIGWAGYRYIDTYVRPPIGIDDVKLIAKSVNGMCSFFSRGVNTYTVEYYVGFDKDIGGNIVYVARFSEYPQNISDTCSLLKEKRKLPLLPKEPQPMPLTEHEVEIIK